MNIFKNGVGRPSNNIKRARVIIAIVAVVLSLTIGYALFSQQVKVTGTATASGTFNMMIANARVKESEGVINPTVNISTDKQSVSFSADNLQYPGAYVTFEYTLKNAGTINSMYKTRKLSGTINGASIDTSDNEYDYLDMFSYKFFPSSEMDKLYFEPNDTSIETFTITWNPEDEENNGASNSISYSLSLNFEQVTSSADVCNAYSVLSNKIEEIMNCLIEDPEPFNYFFDFDGDGRIDAYDLWYVEYPTTLLSC